MVSCLSWWFIVFLQHIWNILPFSSFWQFLSIFAVSEGCTCLASAELAGKGSVLACGQLLLSGVHPASLIRLVSTEHGKPNSKFNCKGIGECYSSIRKYTLSTLLFKKYGLKENIGYVLQNTQPWLQCKGYTWKYKPSNWRFIEINNEWKIIRKSFWFISR